MRGVLAVACGLALIWGLGAFIIRVVAMTYGSP